MAGVTAVDRALLTADVFLRLPDNGMRRELVRGVVRERPPAGEEQGAVAGDLLVHLGHHVRTSCLGQVYASNTGFRLARDPDTVLCPDVSYVGRERIAQVAIGKGFRNSAPDLAVEVVSPEDLYYDVYDRIFAYLESGCRMVVVVAPSRRNATVFHPRNNMRVLRGNDAIDGGSVVPGWKLPVKEIFASL